MAEKKEWWKLRGTRIVLYVTAGLTIGAALLVSGAAYVLYSIETPDVGNLQQAKSIQPSIVLSGAGKPIATLRQKQQQWVGLDEISPDIQKALIATEDRRFREHHGVDYVRTFYAAFHTATGDIQGGSTITQQLARNLFPQEIGNSRTVMRKLKEMLTALKIERNYSKEQILETYLNTVPFLYNVTGIEMAARTYFGKPAAQLDAAESAMLVGMLKGTSYYNPVANPDRALQRRNVVLAQMEKAGWLSDHEFVRLKREPLGLHFVRYQDYQDESMPHFIAYVRRWMADWAKASHIDPYAEGLTIETTIDPSLQQAAVDAVKEQARALQDVADVEWGMKNVKRIGNSTEAYSKLHKRVEPFEYFWKENPQLLDAFIRDTPEFDKAVKRGEEPEAVLAALKEDRHLIARLRDAKTRLEAGFVAIDPATGEVKAWVGSRDFNRDQFDHVAQAARQPGSTFKPIVYGAALQQGFSPEHAYIDAPVSIRFRGKLWQPTDMSGFTGQPMSLREGLVYSKNVITAQVMQDVGMTNIVDLARAAGINRSRLDPVPSLALGTSPVTLLEMASAYATIAQTGEYHKPIFVRRILDRHGVVLADFSSQQGERAMSEDAAIQLIDMMRGVIDEGTGTQMRTRFGVAADIAGKTGTTQNNTDGWFILMHPQLVAGAWIGFNDPRVTMRSDYWGQGGHNAVLAVGEFFRSALKAKLIDVRARFPRPPQPQLITVQARPQDWRGMIDSLDQPAPGTGVIVRSSDGARTRIAAQGEVGSKSGDELALALRKMGRDPGTGERVESSGGGSASSGASGKD